MESLKEGKPVFREEGTRLNVITPFSPPSTPATGSWNGLHHKSKFLAIRVRRAWPGDPGGSGNPAKAGN
jgi:hypothetical protein